MKLFMVLILLTTTANAFALDLKEELYGVKPSLEIQSSRGPQWQDLMKNDVYNRIADEYPSQHFDDNINHDVDFEACVEDQIKDKLDPKRHDGTYTVDYGLFEGEFDLDEIVAVKKKNSQSRSVAYGVKPLVIYWVSVYASLKDGVQSKDEKGLDYETLKGIYCKVDFTGYYFYNNPKKAPKTVDELEFLGSQEEFQKPAEQLELFKN